MNRLVVTKMAKVKNPANPEMAQPPPRKLIHLPKVRMLSRGLRSTSGIRITNVRSIRLPNPQLAKKQEVDKLRAEVQQEIVSRSRACAYPGYDCWGTVVSGRQYCAKHILRDPTAPYVQCAHNYANGERCPVPAPAIPDPKEQKDPPLCFEHARAGLLARQRAAAPPPPVVSTEALLNQLQHYVNPERARTTSCASSVSIISEPSEPETISPTAVDPFKQMDATTINSVHSSSILECASCSDSEGEDITLGPGGNCRHNICSSDTEDATVEEFPLWRAGVFTAEEVVSETKTALKALQSAYINQMERLKSLLMTARLEFLKNIKQEKEQYCSINSQARSGPLTVQERRQLRKLKAYAGYHRKHGADAVLARKLAKKRAKANESNPNRHIPSVTRCTFVEETARCSNQSVPASKHCLKHILHDRNQVLFSPCGDIRGVDGCKEPIAKLPLPSDACRYHTNPPAYNVFALKKDDTDSETDSQTSIILPFSDVENEVEIPTTPIEVSQTSMVSQTPMVPQTDVSVDQTGP